MKNNTFVSTMIVAGLLGIGSMFHAVPADASPRTQMMMADASMDMKSMKVEAALNTHHGAGTVRKIDAVKGMVTLAHGSIASLKWPAMTMRFKLNDSALAKGIKAGDVVDFELVQLGDDYVITRLQPSVK